MREKSDEKQNGGRGHAFQETRLLEEQCAAIAQSMKVKGYQRGGAMAIPTVGQFGEPGASAGVAVAVPKDIGTADVRGQETRAISPKGHAGRAVAAWPAVGRGGTVLVPVYLWAAEGIAYLNERLLEHVIGYLES